MLMTVCMCRAGPGLLCTRCRRPHPPAPVPVCIAVALSPGWTVHHALTAYLAAAALRVEVEALGTATAPTAPQLQRLAAAALARATGDAGALAALLQAAGWNLANTNIGVGPYTLTPAGEE